MTTFGRQRFSPLIVLSTIVVFALLIFLLKQYHAHSYIGVSTTRTYKLPSHYNANIIALAGQDKVICIAYADGANYDIRSFSTNVDELSPEPGLTLLFNSMCGKGMPGFTDWRISPDANRIMFIQRSDTKRVVMLFKADGTTLNSVDVSSLGRIYGTWWLPDSRRWLLCGYPPGVTTNWWLATGSNKIDNVVQLRNCSDYYPIGVTASNTLLMIRLKPVQYVSSVDALEEKDADNTNTSVKRDIQLPFRCNIRSVIISPNGMHILWLLQRKSLIPFRLTLHRPYPFIHFTRNGDALVEPSLWISDSDGTHFVSLGDLPVSDLGRAYIDVSPDGTKVGVLLRGQVYIVNIPKR